MPAIPSLQVKRSAFVGGIDTRASPDDFGAQIGGALQNLGRSIGDASDLAGAYAEREQDRLRKENIANRVANGNIGMSELATNAQREAPPDGSGTLDRTRTQQREFIDSQTADIKDPVERLAVRTALTERMAQYGMAAVQFQAQRQSENAKLVADAALRGQANLVRANPAQYDNVVKDGMDVINSRPGFTPAQKAAMADDWTQRAAHARFEGMMYSASTAEEYEKIEAELTAKDSPWQQRMKQEQFDNILDRVRQGKKEVATIADGQARAALDRLESLSKDTMKPLDPAELQSVRALAAASRNPNTQVRLQQLIYRDNIVREDGRLTPSELEAKANAGMGGGGVSYPGLPSEVNTAVNAASRTFDVPASYLGATANQEYGKYLRGTRPANAARFMPTSTNPKAGLEGLTPDTMNGLIMAGMEFGRPLVINSGHRTPEHNATIKGAAKDSRHLYGDAADISTVGMSAEEKTRLVDILSRSGFKFIKTDYPGHIHADRRGDNTPVTIPGGEIDYGRGTDAKDAEGRTASSALGLFQFTKGTWLGIMRSGAAERAGIDIKGKSEDEILQMRADPRVSTMMAAALAEQNSKILTPVLQRKPTDSELYFAHVFGAEGAVAMIRAAADPSKRGDEVLPEAAASNRALFYSRDGKALTAQQVLDNMTTRFSTTPTAAQAHAAQVRRDMAASHRKGLENDPVAHGRQFGVTRATDLNEQGGYAARAAEARATADYYTIPVSDMKPFTKTEAEDMIKRIKEGSSAEITGILANVAQMEAVPGMGKAALAQLGLKDTVLGYAGALAMSGEASTANEIVRGQKVIDADKGADSWGKPDDRHAEFYKVVGQSLQGLTPETQAAIRQAAFAHYANGKAPDGQFDRTAYQKSVKAVVGSLGRVNGYETVLPKGVSADEFDNAISRMTDGDLVRFSESGAPPRDNRGQPVSAREIDSEGAFVAIGGNRYVIRMSDGKLLATGAMVAAGVAQSYVFVADPAKVKEIAARPARGTPAATPPGAPAPTFGNQNPRSAIEIMGGVR